MVKKIDPNLLIAVGVLFASFGALFVYIRQASIMSEQTKILLEQTKANAWPHLSIELYRGHSAKGLNIYKIEIRNKGTGPAIMEQTRITYDNTHVENWEEFHQRMLVPDSIDISYSNRNISGRVLSSNEGLVLVDWSNSDENSHNTSLMEFIYQRADKISIEICYKSIHGDAWTVKREGFRSDLEINERIRESSCALNENDENLIFKE